MRFGARLRGSGVPAFGRTSGRSFGCVLGLAIGLALGWADASPAEPPHRVEVVGTYPIRAAQRGKVNPRDEAIKKAIWEAVSRVALELLGEEGEGESELDETAATTGRPGAAPGAGSTSATAPDPTERFQKLLGRQATPYARSFRIVEDRGERPVLFAEEAGVRSEYLVVVEVLVDVDRVRSELARAGLIEGATTVTGPRQSVTVELAGLEQYAGLRAFIETVKQRFGVTHVATLEFAPGHQVLRLDGPLGATDLARRLGELDSPELLLEPVAVDGENARIELHVQWIPPAPPESPALPATPAPDSGATGRR